MTYHNISQKKEEKHAFFPRVAPNAERGAQRVSELV